MRRVALLSALVPLVCGVAAAAAATMTVQRSYGEKGGPRAFITYAAGSGEANRLRLAYVPGEEWVFEDPGAEIDPGPSCAGGSHRVSCSPRESVFEQIEVRLGDLGDELTVEAHPLGRSGWVRASGGDGEDALRAPAGAGGPSVAFDGGAGDDLLATDRGGTLYGAAGSDRLHGGPAVDMLEGDAGADELIGGAANDSLNPGRDHDPDLIDGGPGRDHLSYHSHRDAEAEPLTIDMAAWTAAPGDVLRSIESVSGGNGPDVVRGSDRSDHASGGAGDDVLYGGPGDDVLDGVEGADRLLGGPGDDVLRGWGGRDELSGGAGDDRVEPWEFDYGNRVERIGCGGGTDTVPLPDQIRDVPARFRFVPRDCELVDAEASMLRRFRARPVIARGAARWSLVCTARTWRTGCPVRFEVRGGGRRLGTGRITLRRGRRATLVVPLSPAGRRSARRGGRIDVVIRMKTHYGGLGLGFARRYSVDVPAA